MQLGQVIFCSSVKTVIKICVKYSDEVQRYCCIYILDASHSIGLYCHMIAVCCATQASMLAVVGS